MALKLYERYPQLWESPSNDYPQGAFKNLSAQGETDGSYLEKDWLNDYSGFFGALLRNAEMTPDGTIDTAQRSQFYDALVAVAKKAAGEEGYRKIDDNIFNGYLQVRSEHEGQETGVFLQDTDGTIRGQVVATDQGLQLTQYPKDGGLQTFTFLGSGGEISENKTIYVKDYLEMGDNEAVSLAFDKANNSRMNVSFAGISSLTLDADLVIDVMTNVDFCGCHIKIKNGIKDNPSWSTQNPLFIVRSDNELEEVDAEIVNNFLKLSDDKYGYALLESDFKVTNRNKTWLANYIQSFSVYGGVSTTRISANHDNNNIVSVKFRSDEKSRLEIRGINLDRSTFNNSIILKISRNNVDIYDVSDNKEEFIHENDISSVIYLDNVADVTLNNIDIKARTITVEGNPRGYAINLEGASNVRMCNIKGAGGGAVIASNHINQVYLNNSYVDRFDCHSSGHNMYAENTVFIDRAIGIGWGGGDIKVKNCTLKSINSAFITDRPDYDGSFYNCTMSVTDSTLYTNNNRSRAFVWLASWGAYGGVGVGNDLKTTVLPDDIIVRDCTVRDSYTLKGNNVTMGIWVAAKIGVNIEAPKNITIDNITTNTGELSRVGNFIQLEDMYGTCNISISNFKGQTSNYNKYASRGFILNTGTEDSSNDPKTKIYLNIINCDFIAIKTYCENGSIKISNSIVQAVRTDLKNENSKRNRIVIDNCEIMYPLEPTELLGYRSNPGNAYNSSILRNSVILGDFEIGDFDVCGGNVVNSAVKLPAHISNTELLFTGYKKGFFN